MYSSIFYSLIYYNIIYSDIYYGMIIGHRISFIEYIISYNTYDIIIRYNRDK